MGKFKLPWTNGSSALDDNERQQLEQLQRDYPKLKQSVLDYQSANARLVRQYDKVTDNITKLKQQVKQQGHLGERIHQQKQRIHQQKQMMVQKDHQLTVLKKQIKALQIQIQTPLVTNLRQQLTQKGHREAELNDHIHHQKQIIEAQNTEINALIRQVHMSENHSINHKYMSD